MRALELAAKSETKLNAGNRSLRLQLQRLLMCSLGPSPAVDCLKYMYGFDFAVPLNSRSLNNCNIMHRFGYASITAVPRDSIRNRSHACMDAAWVSPPPPTLNNCNIMLPHSIIVTSIFPQSVIVTSCSQSQEL